MLENAGQAAFFTSSASFPIRSTFFYDTNSPVLPLAETAALISNVKSFSETRYFKEGIGFLDAALFQIGTARYDAAYTGLGYNNWTNPFVRADAGSLLVVILQNGTHFYVWQTVNRSLSQIRVGGAGG